MKLISIFGAFLVLFTSCQQKNKDLSKVLYNQTKELEKISINISIDDQSLTSYSFISTYPKEDNKEYLYAYNRLTHSIDKFNIDNKTVSHISLATEGKDGVLKNISGLCVSNPDSIWIYSQENLYLINSIGKVTNSFKLPIPEGGFIMIDKNFSRSTSTFYYHPARNSIFYLAVTPNKDRTKYNICEYSILTDNLKSFEIEGNSIENKAGTNFGWKQMPNVTFTDKYIIYNYPISSNIYYIDIKTGKKNTVDGQSKYTKNLVSELTMPYDFQKADKHLLENVHFFEVIYSPKENVYYRLHLDKIASYSKNKEFNEQYESKNIYLTILDSNFHIINEQQLSPKTYNYFNGWGITKKGLLIFIENILDTSKNPDILQMDIFCTNP